MAGDGKKGDDGRSNSDEKMLTPYALTSNDNPSNIITQVQLKDLVNCKQEGQGIVVYYGRLKSLWDELNNYDSIPICTCTGCKCNITTQLEKKQEEERVHQFLMGLYEDGYETVRSNILSIEPLLNLNRVYAMIVQQERVRTMTRTKEERGGRSGGRGHGVQQGTGGGQGRGGTTRAMQFKHQKLIGGRSFVTDCDRTGISGLSNEQWATLLTMLNSHKGGANERLIGKQNILPWIIDTGASHHMTGTYECLNDMRDIIPCPVGLPNGAETKVLKEGTVTLGEKLKLRHDRNLRMLIRASEQREGLYFLKGVAPIRAYKTTSIASYELWHRRMGHPSSRVVDLIYEVDSVGRNDGVKNKFCDICFRAQQTREVLFSSDNKAKECFDLIHCDYGKLIGFLLLVEDIICFIGWDVIFVEAEFPYFNNVVNSSLTENRVVDYSVDDGDSYMQNDREEQQASILDVEHEIGY
ncbi:hypothetical protein CK203_103163 [Vitis vinifera]|uniref:Uncharacterized protein n=1 Tax=Vitis vinifera TaxID=29760 RepID=A0A438DN45_VITVI|nr:hypothetical protein CK203_103163 [Vitis vinifera]